jgi:hypothetical protein
VTTSSTPEDFSPYPSSEVDSPAPNSSPLIKQSRALFARTSTPRGTPSRSEREDNVQGDGDDKLKNFFQSLLVNKGK